MHPTAATAASSFTICAAVRAPAAGRGNDQPRPHHTQNLSTSSFLPFIPPHFVPMTSSSNCVHLSFISYVYITYHIEFCFAVFPSPSCLHIFLLNPCPALPQLSPSGFNYKPKLTWSYPTPTKPYFRVLANKVITISCRP